ncbi:conserved hypothetical protein [Ricinus communis]|uniref:Uncharacterized protein n=1 Tax=Ricinus communis TaxID=3988 RepID=B9SIJ5_RICCO|nr:conserved hypothetical protein [Ricinus communis]
MINENGISVLLSNGDGFLEKEAEILEPLRGNAQGFENPNTEIVKKKTGQPLKNALNPTQPSRDV